MSNEMVGGKYLVFNRDLEMERGRKTQYWNVNSATQGNTLGVIKWYAPWRQYIFEPWGAIFNHECLWYIMRFLQNLMDERKNA